MNDQFNPYDSNEGGTEGFQDDYDYTIEEVSKKSLQFVLNNWEGIGRITYAGIQISNARVEFDSKMRSIVTPVREDSGENQSAESERIQSLAMLLSMGVMRKGLKDALAMESLKSFMEMSKEDEKMKRVMNILKTDDHAFRAFLGQISIQVMLTWAKELVK